MKWPFLLLLLLLCCQATLSRRHEVKDKHEDEENNSKHESKSKVDKLDKVKKEKESKGSENDSANSTSTDDYDTTQGYPILFPETHMMSLKRNLTSSQNNTQSMTSLEDDDMLNEDANVTNKALTPAELGKCSKSVDLLFVLDSSESVRYSNWKLILQFVKNLCDRFKLESTRIGIIRYASDAEIALSLTLFNDTQSRDASIDDIFYKTGGTRTDIALKKAAEVFQTEVQKSQVLILVTDGPTNSLEIDRNHFVEGKDLVAGPVDKLKDAGVALFCIGIEPDSETPDEVETMKEEMRVIASEPTKQHLFLSDGYHELERKVTAISEAACVVNGAWSLWSEYSPCSVTCGEGTKVRMRTCTNPKPENNGADCTGPRVEIEECFPSSCSATEPLPSPSIHKNTPSNATTFLSQTSITTLPPTPPPSNNNAPQTTSLAPTPHAPVVAEQQLNDKFIEQEKIVTNFTLSPSTTPPLLLKWVTNVSQTPPNKNDGQTNLIGGCFEGLEEIRLNDSQYNASSVYSHDTDDEYVKREYAPPNARLNNEINGGGWCAEHRNAVAGDKSQWLQFDLGQQMTVNAVGTQGSHLLENWVKGYNLRFSDDAISWEFYQKNPLQGNTDRHAERRNYLSPPITARYVQINPIEWNEANGSEKHDICLRAALYKCRDGAVAPVKRGGISHHHTNNVIHERQSQTIWSHQNPMMADVRSKRHNPFSAPDHKVPHKRILHRLRTVASRIMKTKKRNEKIVPRI